MRWNQSANAAQRDNASALTVTEDLRQVETVRKAADGQTSDGTLPMASKRVIRTPELDSG